MTAPDAGEAGAPAPPAPARTVMLVNAREKEETRIAIAADGRLTDFHVERPSHGTRVGSIYKGRVENVHPSLQAAFVSIGLERNAFLHVSEVHGPGEDKFGPKRAGPRPKRLIQNLLKPGQEAVVQVIRDEFGNVVGHGGDPVQLTIDGAAQSLTDQGNGTYTLGIPAFTLAVGTHQVVVTLGGANVSGSPYSMTVTFP